MNLRWIVEAAGWAAFSAAVWFVGDVVAPLESPAARMTLIAAAALGLVAWELARAWRSRKENKALLDGIARSVQGDSASRAAHELNVLRKRMEDALAALRKARFVGADGVRRTVAELPWYMFIGAPGSGKTTALLNAGLRFPLGDPRGEQALQGVGGTRNCDWWFTEAAVLLDTAGRYTTQESDREADAAAWLGFLDMLKRNRPRQPLNGVIVTVSVGDLVHWSEQDCARYAAHLRERVAELTTRLGVRLPVYVMVTKADLLAGFMEFFGHLDSHGRSQVWGMTFRSQAEAGLVKRFQEEFAGLEKRLYGVLPLRLQDERDLQRRAAIYRFPQQFRGLGPLLALVLEGAFGAGWRGEPPLVRGVYFTSGTQEGSPIDRVLGTLARTFNLERKVQPPAVGSGKSFFLRRLLHDVIFGEAALGRTDLARLRRQRTLRLAAYAAMAVVTVALAGAWTASFFANRALVAEVQARTEAASRSLSALKDVRPGDEARLLATLSALRSLAPARSSALAGFGLDQRAKLAAQAERAYRNSLRETLLGHLALSLENALRSAPTREALEAYVSLYETPGPALLEKSAQALWRLPDSARAELASHLGAALAERPLALPRGRDDALVEQARRKLDGTRA